MLCFRKIRVRPKTRVLLSETLSETLDLEEYSPRHVDGLRVQIERSGVDSTAGGYRPTVDVYGTCGMAQTPLVRFLVALFARGRRGCHLVRRHKKSNHCSLGLIPDGSSLNFHKM